MENAQDNAGVAPSSPPFSGRSVAVTGATGFIGGRLVEMLAERGANVTCLIRGNQADMRLHCAGAHIRKLDLTDEVALRAVLRGIDVVFHLAYDGADAAWNHRALSSLIEVCSTTGCRLVHASSFAVYGLPQEGMLTEDSPATSATEGYPHIKCELEALLLGAVRDRNLLGTIVQPTIVYGPFSRIWTIDPADRLRYGTAVLPDSGEGMCNAVYVDDVAGAMLLAATNPGAVGQRYLISGAAPVTWRAFYEGIARAIDARGPECWPEARITREGSAARRLIHVLAHPTHVVRKIARSGPGRRLTGISLRLLPPRLQRRAQEWVALPVSRWRGRTHLPAPGHCEFLQSRMVVSSAKAHEQLGYVAAFGFEEGMVPTAAFLERMYAQREQPDGTPGL
jgi:nucleoside-diphosphate-sugar epimerase